MSRSIFNQHPRAHRIALDWNSISFALLIVGIALIWITGPLITSDGPIHISFARITRDGPGNILQNQIYEGEIRLIPNILVYIAISPLFSIFDEILIEKIVQILCIIILPISIMFFAKLYSDDKFISILFGLSFSFNQLFFWGLYNYIISLGFSVFSLYFLILSINNGKFWYIYSLSLAATVLSHGGGFFIALAFSAALMIPLLVWGGQERGFPDRRKITLAFSCALIPTVLIVLYFSTTRPEDGGLAFGPSIGERLRALVMMDRFAANGPAARVAPTMLVTLLLGLWCYGMWQRLRRWRPEPETRVHTAQLVALVLAAMFLCLAIPDTAGGGWSHAARMQIAPPLALLIGVATHTWIGWFRAVAFGGGALGLAAVIAGTIYEQISIRKAANEIHSLLENIPPRCTLLPIIRDPKDLGTRRADVTYPPLFQVATRIEHQGDRVSLFNWLARLQVYPVRYLPDRDPHDILFGWPRNAQSPRTERLDILGFEARSGITVNYLMVQGTLESLPPSLRPAGAEFVSIANTPTAGFVLYRREGLGAGQPCL